jgi:hypothetical protein
MLNDLAALTPPFLVCVAFLIAVWAFLRHEMRRSKNAGEDDDEDVSRQPSANADSQNQPDSDAASGSVPDGRDDN